MNLAQKMKTTADEKSSLLRDFENEILLLRKLLIRNKNQHRRTKIFSYLSQVITLKSFALC